MLRVCGNVDVDVECRAWTVLAEVGMRMGIEGVGVEGQVESAITKGVRPSPSSSNPNSNSEPFVASIITKRTFVLLE